MTQTLIIDMGGTFATVVITTQQDLDVTTERLAHLRDALKAFLPQQQAPKRPRPQKKAAPAAAPADDKESERIRKWAQDNDYEVAAHGRLPKAVRQAYHERREVTPLSLASSSPSG